MLERARADLPPRVGSEPGVRRKTHGRWWTAGGSEPAAIVSGRDYASRHVDELLRERGFQRKAVVSSDVELKLAARMADNGITDATIVNAHRLRYGARRYAIRQDLQGEELVKLQAWYVHDGPTIVNTATELDAVLDDVAGARDGDMIELSDAVDPMSRGILLVGLDATRGVGVAFWTADQDGYYSSNGGPVTDEPLTYYYQDNERAFPADAEVPLTTVRRAAHDYLSTGERPTALRWRLDGD